MTAAGRMWAACAVAVCAAGLLLAAGYGVFAACLRWEGLGRVMSDVADLLACVFGVGVTFCAGCWIAGLSRKRSGSGAGE